MLDAVVDVVARNGYGALTIEQVVVASGVSRRTFYDHFANKEDVFLAAYDRIVDRLVEVVDSAYNDGGNWADQLQRGLATFLEFLGSEPAVAHVCVVDILAAGPTALARRTEAMARFRGFFVPDPSVRSLDHVIPPLAAEAAIGGAYEVVYSQILAGNAGRLPELLPDLLHGLLVPFVDPDTVEEQYEAARRRRRPDPPVS
jgi:AcrR family transcriptional regulator